MTFTKEALRKDQPLRRDQKSRPQSGHYLEVLLYYPASLSLIIYPLWLIYVYEDSFPTQFSDPEFSFYRIQ